MEETTKLIDDMISETPSQPNGATIADAKGCCFPVDRPAVAGSAEGVCWRKHEIIPVTNVATRAHRPTEQK